MKNHLFSIRQLKPIFVLSVFLILFASIPVKVSAEEDVVIIGSANVPVDSLRSVDVMNIYLGKKTTWDNGNQIVFVTLKSGETHKKLLRDYLNKNPVQFKNYWKQMLFTGKGSIPQSFATDDEVIDYISKNENVIGYISKAVSGSGLKMISITN